MPIKIAVSLVILIFMLLAVQPLPVPAAASLIQDAEGGCPNTLHYCDSFQTTFLKPVASGDVIVVGAIDYTTSAGSMYVPTIFDSKGSNFHLAVSYSNTQTSNEPFSVFIWVATLSSGGSDTVTLGYDVTLGYSNPGTAAPSEFRDEIYEVSGVTTGGAKVDAANGFGTAISVSGLPFVADAFLLGMIGYWCPIAPFAPSAIVEKPGPGFALAFPSTGPCFSLDGQFSYPFPYVTDGGVPTTSGVTTFPATLSNIYSQAWVEVAIVLNPSSSTSTASPTLSTSTASQTVNTDWAVVSIGTQPSSPTEGTAVKLEMMMTALSTTGGYPQNVAVQCIIDGSSCGSGRVAYPGPNGVSFTVSASNPWIAILGTHTISWQIDAANDPNPANNVMSISFTVQSSSSSYQSVSTTSTQFSTSQSSTEQVTIVQTQTVTQQPTSTKSEATSQPGILDILQQNSLLLIGALGLLVIVLAIATMKRGKHGSQAAPS